ncbi:MAG: hypothetical protein E6Q68_00860 [Polynucleobacter sp.]|nr:MAG: hypothetical protein E6Q68_00860 [Polynucleobacter sp.]
MLRLDPRKIMNRTTDELFTHLKGRFKLKFDDGDLEVSAKGTLYSHYFWNILRAAPNAPMLKCYHVDSFITEDKTIDKNTNMKLLGNVLWGIYRDQVGKMDDEAEEQFKDRLFRLAYDVNNMVYNDLMTRCSEYVTGLNIDDVLEVMLHPSLLKTKEGLKPSQESVAIIQNKVKDLINKDKALAKNPLAQGVKAGVMDISQVQQTVGCRGQISDINSRVFQNVIILDSYASGIKIFVESLTESRMAAMALAYSKKPLEDSEYFSRRVQLIGFLLRHVYRGDCGSDKYLIFHVQPEQFDTEGNMISKGDLPSLKGMYYLNEETGLCEAITAAHRHLAGKTIKLRNIVSGCRQPQANSVCSTCFGDLSLSLFRQSNAGVSLAVQLLSAVSQKVLSVKHFTNSSVADLVQANDSMVGLLEVNKEGDGYKLARGFGKKGSSVIIPKDDFVGIMDLYAVDDVTKLSMPRVTKMRSLEFRMPVKGLKAADPITTTLTCNVEYNRREASLSYAFLKYLKEVGHRINEDGHYEIGLDEWDETKSLLRLPIKNYTVTDYSSDISNAVESSMNDLESRREETSPESLLTDFHDLTNSQMDVNFGINAVIIYTSMTTNPEEKDYNLPKAWDNGKLGVMSDNMKYRSIAPSFSFKNHKATIQSPATYLHVNRPDHPMDSLFIPTMMNDSIRRIESLQFVSRNGRGKRKHDKLLLVK